jgi:hypothetical protein
MNNLDMYCLCIHDELYEKINSLGYIAVGLGNKVSDKRWLRDNTQENISYKNRFYGEYTFHYWLWKNKLKNYDNRTWIGFCAYRRFWLKKNTQINTFSNLSEVILKKLPQSWENYEVILGNRNNIDGLKIMKLLKYGKTALIRNPRAITKKGRNIRFQFDMFHGNGNLDKAIKLLGKKDQSDFKDFVIKNNSFNQGNMFICNSKIIMHEFYNVVFEWFDKLEDIYGFSEDSYGRTRIYAFLAERFLPYWFNKYTKTLEWPILFHDTSKE